MLIKFYSIFLVLVGAGFMTASALAGRKLKKEVPADVQNKWDLISSFIIFFLSGYLAFIIILFLDLKFPLEFLTAGIFLGGSIFVFLIINLAKYTILRMKAGEKEIDQVNLKLQEKNKALEKEILERIQAEKAHIEAENKYRSIFENAVEGIYQSSLEGDLIQVNPAFAGILGYESPEDMMTAVSDIGRQMYVDSNQRQELLQQLERGPVADFEVQLYGKDMKKRWVSLHARKSYIAMENRYIIDGIALDIMDRKKVEWSLQESEERYRDLFESASDLIQILNPEGKFMFVNRSWRKTFGYSPEEIADLSIHGLIASDCGEECALTFQKILAEGKAERIKTVFVAKNGNRIMIEGSANCKFKDGKPFQVRCIFRDVTEQKKLEAQLLQSQKMEAVGRLTGGVAHDFNNLLSTILGYGEISLRRLEPESPVYGNIKLIIEAGRRAGSLTRQLLAFSRKQILEMKVINLESIIENMVKMFNRLLAKNIKLEINFSQARHNIKADPGQVEQVLMNLVVNAKDAMPRGGVLTIETGEIILAPEDVSAPGGLPPGCYVSMTVSDSGEGMTADIISQVFDPFFTTKAPDKGTGLGLSTVYGIIKQHNGHISVSSAPGKGSTFTVLFPAITEAAHEEAPMQWTAAGAGNEKILVVDDDPDIIRLVDDALTPLGYRIIAAPSAKEGLKISDTMGSEIDLILTDVVMPDMSGFAMADAIKKNYPAMKVILMSGYTEDVVSLHGSLQAGMTFINKPLFPSKLTTKIRETLDGKTS